MSPFVYLQKILLNDITSLMLGSRAAYALAISSVVVRFCSITSSSLKFTLLGRNMGWGRLELEVTLLFSEWTKLVSLPMLG